MEFEGVITKHEPPNLSACYLTGPSFDLDVEYQFDDRSGSTQVTVSSQVFGKGFFKVMVFLTGWMMKNAGCKAQESELDNLRRLLEAKTS